MNTRRSQISSSPLASPLYFNRRHRDITDDTASQTGNAAVSVFVTIYAPVLRSMDPFNVAKLLKERERDELQIVSKQAELPALKALAYTAIINRTFFKSLFYIGKFDDIAKDATTVNELTDDNVQLNVNSLVPRSEVGVVDPLEIEKDLVDITMHMNIADADA